MREGISEGKLISLIERNKTEEKITNPKTLYKTNLFLKNGSRRFS